MSLSADFTLTRGTLGLRVRLCAEPGEVVAVVGPNGAGKTSCLRVIAGLERVEAGRVELDGMTLDDAGAGTFVAPERRAIGYVFQDYLLFPHLTVSENVAFGLHARGDRDARAQVDAWLDRLGLTALASVRPGRLSGGQAQRVALARALAVAPRVLLLDEPLAALDAASKVDLRRELARQLAAFAGITVLVTHDVVDAAVLADRVVVLEGGEVVQEGDLHGITARPRSRYAADLAGVNFWRSRAERGRLHLDGGVTIVAASDLSGEACAMVPPRAVALYPRRPEGTPRNVWPGRVAGIERLGDRVRVQVKGELDIVAEVTPAAVADLHLGGDEQVWVAVKASEVDLYPA